MFRIVDKRVLNSEVVLMTVEAPFIARKALPGQFIIFRIDQYGERVPLTISDYDREAGTVTIIFQIVGKSTRALARLEVGDELEDFVGPLGKASHLDGLKRVCVIGGGLGTAIAFPQAKYLHNRGAEVDIIAGFRNKDIVILEDEMRTNCTNLYITTDDGSYGEKGFVSDKLRALIEGGEKYEQIIVIGPLIMMKVVCDVTKEYGIKTEVSMNTVMLDGTGMCGACRLTVDGETKFACVDGPDFDGHKVDFVEAMSRNTIFRKEERDADGHYCNLIGGIRRD
jgi:2-polyprenylphenol hydroxylase and related flavodoxin oxidoreductases